ncbi:hypothetical protein [Dactylosporangium sp. NPDC051541]|uniref:hypothetical protein n=1 Tax=Dactylosporangium sp. NPDC051541 TaxID=3363977 RepID=UPI0037AE0979
MMRGDKLDPDAGSVPLRECLAAAVKVEERPIATFDQVFILAAEIQPRCRLLVLPATLTKRGSVS